MSWTCTARTSPSRSTARASLYRLDPASAIGDTPVVGSLSLVNLIAALERFPS